MRISLVRYNLLTSLVYHVTSRQTDEDVLRSCSVIDCSCRLSPPRPASYLVCRGLKLSPFCRICCSRICSGLCSPNVERGAKSVSVVCCVTFWEIAGNCAGCITLSKILANISHRGNNETDNFNNIYLFIYYAPAP